MSKRKLVLFGASGGLGSGVLPLLSEKYDVTAVSSKDVDITDNAQVKEFFDSNSFDAVINLSGFNYDSFMHKITDTNRHQINKILDITLHGNINILSNCLPHMRKNKFGRIILISSVLAEKTVISTGVYSAAKSFVDTLVRVTSAENITNNITCNSIRLGYFDAGMCHRIPEAIAGNIKNTIGLKRWGTMQELVNTIDFLINTEYLTGKNITIDGGLA